MSNPTPDTGSLAGTALDSYGHTFSEDRGRDAIHLAVKAMVAGERLWPGQNVGVAEDGMAWFDISKVDHIGIVDPFLEGSVMPGQWFWLTLYPRTITSLRHEWTHPAFPEGEAIINIEDPKSVSERWLREFCRTSDCPDYDIVMAAIKGETVDPDGDGDYYVRWDDDYILFGGRGAHASIPAEFWMHVETVLGIKIPHEKQVRYFSCSC